MGRCSATRAAPSLPFRDAVAHRPPGRLGGTRLARQRSQRRLPPDDRDPLVRQQDEAGGLAWHARHPVRDQPGSHPAPHQVVIVTSRTPGWIIVLAAGLTGAVALLLAALLVVMLRRLYATTLSVPTRSAPTVEHSDGTSRRARLTGTRERQPRSDRRATRRADSRPRLPSAGLAESMRAWRGDREARSRFRRTSFRTWPPAPGSVLMSSNHLDTSG